MRAVVAAPRSPSRVELRDVAEPEPGEREALVEVRAVSLNRGECVALESADDGWRPGWDVAGVVAVAAARAGGPPVGAHVVGWVNGGGWAERVAVRVAHLAELPTTVGFEEASTLPVAGLTALCTLEAAGRLPGARVAVTGANGGVGRFAIQIARASGAHVTAVVTRPERAAGLREIGADEIEVGLEADGEPFDVILESVGGRSLASALARVSPEGVVVSFGNSSGNATEFDARAFYRRGAPMMRGFFVTYELLKERIGADELARLASLLVEGRLRADIDLVTSFDQAASAVDALLGRRVAGKVVLRVP